MEVLHGHEIVEILYLDCGCDKVSVWVHMYTRTTLMEIQEGYRWISKDILEMVPCKTMVICP